MKSNILSILLFFFPLLCLSQKQANNWFFGINAGISFATGSPVALTGSAMNQNEGAAVISDENGNLLFYTDGTTVWNRQHAIMENGTGLNGHATSTQSAIIVPQPGSDSIYFVFTCDWQGRPRGVCYSIVNISNNNGLGRVTSKNISLLTPATEKLTAVMHCNNRDIWVLTRAWNSANYVAWLVTQAGVSLTPVISVTPNYIFDPDPVGNNIGTTGYMKASPDGKKIAATFATPLGYTELSDFNSQTGAVTNTLNIPNIYPSLFNPRPDYIDLYNYGVEFSPNGRLLYISSYGEYIEWINPYRQYGVSAIYQFNISVHDSLQIVQSMKIIDTSNINVIMDRLNRHGALQLGTDNKIYIAQADVPFLSSIQAPNNIGAACNFQLRTVPLTGKCLLGLPTYIQSYFGNNTYNFTHANNCTSKTVNFQINNTQGYSSIKWIFDDPASGINNTSALPNPTHNFTAAGIYNVKLIVNKNNNPCAIPDTINKQIWVGNVTAFLGSDTTICEKDTIALSLNAPNGVNYLWSNNTTGNSVKVTNPGNYWLRITAGACIYTDTIKVAQQLLPRFTLGNDAAICANDSIKLQPNALITNGNYLWSTSATSNSITVKNAGSYWLRAKDNLGCTWRDTVLVTAKQLPNFNLGKDTSICELQSLFLNTQVANAGYLWSTGSLSQSVTVSNSGIYWASVTKDGCTYRDSIQVTVKPLPVVNLGKDSSLCEDNTLQLNVFNTGAAYLWQDSSVNAFFIVKQRGTYFVKVTKNGCSKADTLKVEYKQRPRFTLGPDKTICNGESILLQPQPSDLPGFYYEWQNSPPGSVFNTEREGLYMLKVTNSCGSTNDSIQVKLSSCTIYVPTAFTPNGDGLNDLLHVANTYGISFFELKVFNRWGQLVFQTNDKNSGWNGRFQNQDQPAGNYIWVLNYRENGNEQIKKRKGIVLLIR
jgi:gliding motility-associated-like protein